MSKSRLLNDPWRSVPVPEALKETKSFRQDGPPPPPPPRPQHEDIQEKRHATLTVPRYGGITLDGGVQTTDVAVAILDFFVEQNEVLEELLSGHGIIVVQVDKLPEHVKFYIRREDGWTVALPGVANRQAGCMQLIQAFLEIQRDSKLKKLMTSHRLRVYKM